MPGHRDLTFRTDYFGDTAAWLALSALIEDIFGIDVTVLDRLGGPDPSSVPFAFFDAAGACIANITAFSLPLVVGGAFVRAAGLQSGAVRPDFRGRGLYRSVMQAALDHCDAENFEAVALLTDTPELYQRYGFRPLALHRFVGPAPAGGIPSRVRRLDMANEADVTMLARLLEGRRPVSDRFAPLRQKEMFLFNAALDAGLHLDLMEEDAAVIAWRREDDGGLSLLDIVATRMPCLADILASLRIAPPYVTVHFAPDHLGWEGRAVPDTQGLVLMLRSVEDLRPALPFGLPPMAEF